MLASTRPQYFPLHYIRSIEMAGIRIACTLYCTEENPKEGGGIVSTPQTQKKTVWAFVLRLASALHLRAFFDGRLALRGKASVI